MQDERYIQGEIARTPPDLPKIKRTVEEIGKEIVERLIPKNYREYYLIYALPKLAKTGKLTTSEDWEMYCESLSGIPKDLRAYYTAFVLPAIIKSGILDVSANWIENAEEYSRSVGLMPESSRRYYTESALPALIRTGLLKTPKCWDKYRKSLDLIPEDCRVYYTQFALPALIRTGEFTLDRIRAQVDIIREYISQYGDLDFIWKTGFDNFGNLHPVDSRGRSLKFEKTDGVLQVFGGKLSGVIIRTVSQRAYDAWVKAIEAGIPCEEILKYTKRPNARKYRAKETEDGNVRVACLYGGQSIHEFFRNPENERYKADTEAQRDRIEMQLKQNNIEYIDPHNENFVVRIEDGRPKVRIIDFELAYIK